MYYTGSTSPCLFRKIISVTVIMLFPATISDTSLYLTRSLMWTSVQIIRNSTHNYYYMLTQTRSL